MAPLTKYRWLFVMVLSLIITGCVAPQPTATVTSSGGPTIQQARAEQYNGPKARIAVNRFTNKAAKGGGQIGTGMTDMLTTALFSSNRFIVLDRQDHYAALDEQDLAAAGRISSNTAAPIGEMEGAELLVTGAITAFEPDVSGGIGGVGLPGTMIGLGGRRSEAYMAIDVKVVDARTGRIVAVVTVEGRASEYGGIMGGLVGGVPIPFLMIGYEKTPMEQAVRVVIQKAVDAIASQTPAVYYH